MILGITGNIAAGKSFVAGIFAELGAPVVDADRLARDVVAPGQPALKTLQKRFGAAILDAKGELNRAAMADIVFNDPNARAAINAILHPAIARRSVQTLDRLKSAGHPLIIYESPLLFEAGADNRVDAILVVSIDEKAQKERLSSRDGFDEAAVAARIAAQMPQADKIARADYVIDNSGSRETTRREVEKLYAFLTR